MAESFGTRVLRGFGNLFKTDATRQVPSEIDLGPVQPVVDVGPLARYGAGLGLQEGWLQIVDNLDIAMGMAASAIVNPYTATNYEGGAGAAPEDSLLWLYGVSASTIGVGGGSPTDLQEYFAAIDTRRQIDFGTKRPLVTHWGREPALGGGSCVILNGVSGTGFVTMQQPMMLPRPIPIFQDTGNLLHGGRNVSGGAGSVRVSTNWLCRALPPGVSPVGV